MGKKMWVYMDSSQMMKKKFNPMKMKYQIDSLNNWETKTKEKRMMKMII